MLITKTSVLVWCPHRVLSQRSVEYHMENVIDWPVDLFSSSHALFSFKKAGFSFFSFFFLHSLSWCPNVFRNKYSNHVTRSDGHVKATAARDHISLFFSFPLYAPSYTLTLQKKVLLLWTWLNTKTCVYRLKTFSYICHSNLLLFGNGKETDFTQKSELRTQKSKMVKK